MPGDLRLILAAYDSAADPQARDIWWHAIHRWFDRHGIEVRLGMLVDLAQNLSEADTANATRDNQIRWLNLRDWLEAHEIAVPNGLALLH